MKLNLFAALLFLTKFTIAQVPATWTVNPAAYQYQMTMTCKVNEACVTLVNSNNYIAAFVGSQCRGVIQTSTSAGTDKLGLLTVNSNVVSNEKIKFKIYNATTNSVVAVLDSIIFSQGTQIGTLSNPFTLYSNHSPTNIAISNYTINENSALATTIATLTTSDQDGTTTFNYSLTTGQAENTQFAISGDLLQVNTNFNYETDSIKIIEIYSNDNGGCSFVKTFTIQVKNVNDVPTVLNLTQQIISDKQQANSFMGEFSTIDEDFIDTHTYSLVIGAGDTDNSQFHVSNDTLYNNSQIIYNTQQVYYIRARSTDAGGLLVENTFTLNVINTNDAPTDILLSKVDVDENLPIGTVIGTLTAVDEDVFDTHTFQLVSGTGSTDNLKVAITGSLLTTNAMYNFELQNTLEIRIKAIDSFSATYTKSFTITINDVNDIPSAIILGKDSIAELNPIGTLVDTLFTIDEDVADAHVYSLVSGSGDNDNAMFAINGKRLESNTEFEYNNQIYSIRVRSTDLGGIYIDTILKIRIISLTGGTGILPSTNYISPNDDGKNDYWKLTNVEYFKEFNLQIFDQFGQVIFNKEKNYNNEFDGKYNGKALPTGNYYYIFKKDNRKFQGNITIVN